MQARAGVNEDQAKDRGGGETSKSASITGVENGELTTNSSVSKKCIKPEL